MSPSEHADILKNLEGSFAVEGISISSELKEKLYQISIGKTTPDKVIAELISKYSLGVK